MGSSSYWSLARRQQTILLISLTIVALLLGLGGAWYIRDFAERTSDRVLRASVNAVSETITLEGGKVTLEVPPDAFGMLEDSARDNVYYAVRSGSQVITGYRDFPSASVTPAADETLYRYDTYLGQPVRVASQARYLTHTHPPVVVEVAETLDERHALAQHMLIGLIVLEVLLVAIAAVLISPAVRWGLLPLTRLRKAIEQREGDLHAFEPIDPTQAPHELRNLVETFNALLSRLNNTARRVREFTADASHQMRTPLAALRAHLHLARQPAAVPAERSEALAVVEAAASRLQHLLNQLLALARSESADRAITDPINLFETAAEAARDLAPRAIQKDIEIHLDGEEQLFARVPAVIIIEILSNLIDNAIRYGQRGGTIALKVYEEGDVALIDVEDDGPGIPKKDREAVFQRFYRLDRDHDEPGSGLGLAIVRSLAEAADIAITLLDGSNDSGLLVRVEIPETRIHRERLVKA